MFLLHYVNVKPFFFHASDVCTPEVTRKQPESTVLNGGVTESSRLIGRSTQVTVQRKKLLKAPTLAELDSSESEVRPFLPFNWCQTT